MTETAFCSIRVAEDTPRNREAALKAATRGIRELGAKGAIRLAYVATTIDARVPTRYVFKAPMAAEVFRNR